jgi:TIP41-like family
MPTCIFILSRFTLRVDNVLFRARDTRIYHSFASTPPLVVREMRGWEASYERVKRVNYFRLIFWTCVYLVPCVFFLFRLCRGETI